MRTRRGAFAAAVALLGVSLAALIVLGANEVGAGPGTGGDDRKPGTPENPAHDRPWGGGVTCSSVHGWSGVGPLHAVVQITCGTPDTLCVSQRITCVPGDEELHCSADEPVTCRRGSGADDANREVCSTLSRRHPELCPTSTDGGGGDTGVRGGNSRWAPPPAGWSAPSRPPRSSWTPLPRRSNGWRR